MCSIACPAEAALRPPPWVIVATWYADEAASIMLATRAAKQWLKANIMQERRIKNGRIVP